MGYRVFLWKLSKEEETRQELHEKSGCIQWRQRRESKNGEENNLLELIAQDPAFRLSEDELDNIMEPGNLQQGSKTGRGFLEYIKPILNNNMDSLVYNVELNIASIFANRVLSLS